jgi:very-short-patch-repair endonuclease
MNSYARGLRNSATNAEKHLWRYLRGRRLNGFKFRRQRPMGMYVCDFVCLEAGVVVELDGSQHVADARYDTERDAYLRAHGYRVLRFWNGQVFSETEAVVETICQALSRSEMGGRFD